MLQKIKWNILGALLLISTLYGGKYAEKRLDFMEGILSGGHWLLNIQNFKWELMNFNFFLIYIQIL